MWPGSDETLYQFGHLILLGAFLIPHSVNNSPLYLRCLLCVAFLVFTLWAYVTELCTLDIILWTVLLLVANVVHACILAYKALPPSISSDLQDLYSSLFIPVRLTKTEFTELFRFAEICSLEAGHLYARERVDRIDQRVSILLSGKMQVSCENMILHEVHPNEFLDSPEYNYCTIFGAEAALVDMSSPPGDNRAADVELEMERRVTPTPGKGGPQASTSNSAGLKGVPRTQAANCARDELLAQVSISAVEACRYVTWKRKQLIEETFAHNYRLNCVMNNLIGKDITNKLYLINEAQQAGKQRARARSTTGVASASNSRRPSETNSSRRNSSTHDLFWWRQQMPRSQSVDAVDTTTMGKFRSTPGKGPLAVHHLPSAASLMPSPSNARSMTPSVLLLPASTSPSRTGTSRDMHDLRPRGVSDPSSFHVYSTCPGTFGLTVPVINVTNATPRSSIILSSDADYSATSEFDEREELQDPLLGPH